MVSSWMESPTDKDRQLLKHQLSPQFPVLLLFRHGAKSLYAQEGRLATSHQLVTRLHLPHTIAVRLDVRKSNVVTLTPGTAVTVGVLAVAHPCR